MPERGARHRVDFAAHILVFPGAFLLERKVLVQGHSAHFVTWCSHMPSIPSALPSMQGALNLPGGQASIAPHSPVTGEPKCRDHRLRGESRTLSASAHTFTNSDCGAMHPVNTSFDCGKTVGNPDPAITVPMPVELHILAARSDDVFANELHQRAHTCASISLSRRRNHTAAGGAP